MKKIVIGIVIVAAFVVVVGFVPLMDIPYETTETYYVDEPYEVIETYFETEPLEYHIITSSHGYAMENLPMGAEPPCCFVSITLLNTDTVSGTFIIRFYTTVKCLITIAEDRFSFVSEDYQDDEELYLEPGEIGTMEKYWTEVDIPTGVDMLDECGCMWTMPDVTGSKTIERERTVTKYRQVERERTITRYKKGSIFQYLRSRFSSS